MPASQGPGVGLHGGHHRPLGDGKQARHLQQLSSCVRFLACMRRFVKSADMHRPGCYTQLALAAARRPAGTSSMATPPAATVTLPPCALAHPPCRSMEVRQAVLVAAWLTA